VKLNKATGTVTALPQISPDLRAGLIGRGIQQSRSPRMHVAEGTRLGLSYDYRLFDFDTLNLNDSDLPDLIANLRLEGFSGLNITHPFKERVIPALDRLSADARAIGAVNTVVFDGDEAVGYNTDWWGFAESFKRDLVDPELNSVVMIGAGGAGMAVATALLKLGVQRLSIADTQPDKAIRLVDKLRAEALQAGFKAQDITVATDIEAEIATANGIVNATPVGMAKYPGIPVDIVWLRPDLWVADIIYFPAETELLRAAKSRGCRVMPGAGMAIYQAVMAFELITGAAPDPIAMARHFET